MLVVVGADMQMVVDMSNELDVMGEMNVEVVFDEVWMEVGWMSSPHLHKADGVKLVDDGE